MKCNTLGRVFSPRPDSTPDQASSRATRPNGFSWCSTVAAKGWIAAVSTALASLSAQAAVNLPVNVARDWNQEILTAIRIDRPHPPVHARNLFSLSTAMYDAWAAYDSVSVGFIYHHKHTAEDREAARREAISYAAYQILRERFALSVNAPTSLAALDARMASLGYDKDVTTVTPSTPAGVGNAVAKAVSAWFLNDGSRQLEGYRDFPAAQGGYTSVNPFLMTGMRGAFPFDVNRWQPLAIADGFDDNGLPNGPIQQYVGSQWPRVRPFALDREDASKPWIDPGPPPFLDGEGDAGFRSSVVAMIRASSELSPDDGMTVDISPGAIGNNSLGAQDGRGHRINPITRQPYAPNVVKRGDFGRVVAEYWADGPNSETPPGHWNLLANEVGSHPLLVRRVGGTGPIVDELEWHVKLYFALNAAVHDAACAAWAAKRYYDAWRPITAVRYMGQLGQSSDPFSPSYHPKGLPLLPGLIELVTPDSARAGGRHAGLPAGKVVIRSWPGGPADPKTQYGGVKWILPGDWLPYQKASFVTPAFPGYISGHSTFSRSAASVLAAFTGSPFFPGGMGGFLAGTNYLGFEIGPSEPVQLQWATYFDAADQAGISRIYGGIHPPVDDFAGRKVGSQCGKGVWTIAQKYFNGSILRPQVVLELSKLNEQECAVRYNTQRGFYYKLQSSSGIDKPFVDEVSGGFGLAYDASVSVTNGFGPERRFFRVLSSPTP
ncbi:MAG: vanadium-dependent haloperoxidase [Verrucomicrobiales bacterium]|nr:vanadium-dependent haloperoxidase [Verrucomicrobiales bacterium]